MSGAEEKLGHSDAASTVVPDDTNALKNAIADWLRESMPGSGGVRHIERQPGGASQETWRLVLDTGVVIVRRSAGGAIFDYGVDRRFEYNVLNRMYAAGVPVPQPIAYTDDLLGRPAIAMQWMEGESIGSRVVRVRPTWTCPEELLDTLAQSLVLIHTLEPDDFAFPATARGGDQALGEVDRMRGQLDRLDHPYPALELALRWLERHPPFPARTSIVHGDFRVGNLLIAPSGALNGILDWEFVHLGDPIEDLGWFCVKAWRFGAVDRDAGGIFTRERFVGTYERLAGRAVDPFSLTWWEIYGNVRWAIGAASQASRHLSGVHRDVELAVIGKLVAQMEHEALRMIERVDHE